MSNTVKTVLGVILGSIGYLVGFFIISPLLVFITTFGIFPSFVADFWLSQLTMTALAANGIAFIVFEKFNKNPKAQIGFCIWLIAIAVFYLAAAVLGGDLYLLWYPVCSVILCGIGIKTALDQI